jgi:hypothetical protein
VLCTLQEMLAVLENLCNIDGLRRNYYLDLIHRLEIEKRLVASNRKMLRIYFTLHFKTRRAKLGILNLQNFSWTNLKYCLHMIVRNIFQTIECILQRHRNAVVCFVGCSL